MEILKYLKTHPLKSLEDTLHIEVRYYDDRAVLNYDQIESPKHDPIVRECRGLILSLPDYRVLCRPFDRFFNYTEDPKHEEFAITQAFCFKKIDGSLLNVYHANQWECSTRSMAFAEGNSALGNSFRSIFEGVLGATTQDFFQRMVLPEDLTFSFELVSPETRIVTRYSNPDIYLLNARNRVTGKDIALADLEYYAKQFNVSIPPYFRFDTIPQLVESLRELPPLDEGYVCYWPEKQWRIKVKNPAYLAVAHLRCNGVLSVKRIVSLVCSQDHEEYLSSFPEDREYFQPYVTAYAAIVKEVGRLFTCTNCIEDQKEFALAVKGPVQHIMFALRKGAKLGDFIYNMTDSAKERLFQAFLTTN